MNPQLVPHAAPASSLGPLPCACRPHEILPLQQAQVSDEENARAVHGRAKSTSTARNRAIQMKCRLAGPAKLRLGGRIGRPARARVGVEVTIFGLLDETDSQNPRACKAERSRIRQLRTLREKSGRTALLTRAAERNAIERLSLHLGNCGRSRRAHHNLRRVIRSRFCLDGDRPGAGKRSAQRSLSRGTRRWPRHGRHRAMMEPQPPATSRQMRIRVGQQRRCRQQKAEHDQQRGCANPTHDAYSILRHPARQSHVPSFIHSPNNDPGAAGRF